MKRKTQATVLTKRAKVLVFGNKVEKSGSKLSFLESEYVAATATAGESVRDAGHFGKDE